MLNFLYTVLIFPIETIIEISYLFIFRLCKNPALSVLGVSLVVSILILPLYFMAERLQKEERDIQKKMKAGVDRIKSAFSGDERFMLLSTYYRQNNYHPVYALRSSISLLIQIPFFIGAYHYISHLELIRGVSFGPIANIAKQDSLIQIGNISFNFLPILMTLINCLSVFIYTKGAPLKEKIQLYGMAALFFILLYNSPSALVLYWTSNNLFSLVKNIIQKTKHSKRIIYAILAAFLAPVCVYTLFFHDGVFIRRLALFMAAFFVLLLPLLTLIWNKIKINIPLNIAALENFPNSLTKINFLLSLAGIFLLTGFLTPASLIATSVEEFSFLGHFASPLPYIGFTVLQGIGFSLLIISIYFLFDTRIKNIIALLVTILFLILLVNTLTFTDKYGIMTANLSFEKFESLPFKQSLINMAIIIAVCFMVLFLILLKKKMIFLSLQIILVIALFSYGIFNILNIIKDFKNESPVTSSEKKDLFSFSKTGKNVLVIMLDRAVSCFFPFIIEEKPELADKLRGFVYYPNTIAPGRYTIHGLPGVFGGYYYTPYEIHNRDDQTQMDKLSEAVQVMPRIFEENNFNVYVENMPFIGKNDFEENNNIKIEYNNNAFTKNYVNENGINIFNYYEILYKNLLRFSFFKASPVFLHKLFYDNGDYLSVYEANKNITKHTIDNYSFLYNLPFITEVADNNRNQLILIYNLLTHAPAFLELPDYLPANNVTDRNEGIFSDENHYYVNMASYLLLTKWFDFLKENDVYDNTRIIIVSDHGNSYMNQIPNDIKLPNDRWLRYYNALLLVKDFNRDFELKTDYTFMSNSDVPHIASEGLIEKMVNPFTKKEMLINKNNGYIVTTSMKYQIREMKKYKYNISDDEWLLVHTDIFDPKNWSVYKP